MRYRDYGGILYPFLKCLKTLTSDLGMKRDAGEVVPPHATESGLRLLTVMPGAMSWGDGGKVDETRETVYPPGSVLTSRRSSTIGRPRAADRFASNRSCLTRKPRFQEYWNR